jgi:hypothetical protein
MFAGLCRGYWGLIFHPWILHWVTQGLCRLSPVLVNLFYKEMPELFKQKDQTFSFESHNVTLTCERLDLPKYVAFRVSFSSEREPIVVARAKGMDRPFFWTSIPEGRQKEAEGVGKLIEDYLLDKE